MTSHSSLSLQEPGAAPVNWLELPSDVSASIFRRLSAVDILTSVQYVCPRWRRICRDPSMWRSLHCQYHKNVNNLPKLYRLAVDLSSGGLTDVNLEFFNFKDLLSYIVDRSRNLRSVTLGTWHSSGEVVAALGHFCPLLYSLKVGACEDDVSFAIAKNMPTLLRHLHIDRCSVSKVGLIALLDGCQHLEFLDMSGCLVQDWDEDLDLKSRCSHRIKDFHPPTDCRKWIDKLAKMIISGLP